MSLASRPVDHETAIVFRSSVDKWLVMRNETINAALSGERQADEHCLTDYLRELLAMQQQAVNLGLDQLKKLQQSIETARDNEES